MLTMTSGIALRYKRNMQFAIIKNRITNKLANLIHIPILWHIPCKTHFVSKIEKKYPTPSKVVELIFFLPNFAQKITLSMLNVPRTI